MEESAVGQKLGIFINKVVIPHARLSWHYLAAPDTTGTFADNKYKAELLVPKQGDLNLLRAACKEATQLAVSKGAWPATMPQGQPRPPTADGDLKADAEDGYKDHWILRTKSRRKPLLVGREAEAFYRGCYVRAQVTVIPYAQTKTIEVEGPDGSLREAQRKIYGFSLKLEALRYMGDGDPLDSQASLCDDMLLDDSEVGTQDGGLGF